MDTTQPRRPTRRTFLAGLGGCGLLAVAGRAADTPTLAPLAFRPLPLGRVRPAGWLRDQLRVQAAGLGGHLDEFWPDVKDSAWVGGSAEGWERGPYWLDGFIPLAVLLDDPALKARAQRWVDHILRTQRDDGWLGPVKGNPSQASRLKQYDVWPRFIVLKALTQWQEATGDPRVVPALTKFFGLLDKLLAERPLDEWARARWADLVVSIDWLYDRAPDPKLLALAANVHKQGLDWIGLARSFPYREPVTKARLAEFQKAAGGKWLNDECNLTHGVNVAMGLKAPGVWSRHSHDPADRRAVADLLAALDRYHGQATGMFTCDEHLAGRSPSQGTELCTVVEAMYSLEVLTAVLGDPALADRLERIAFNALPATFKPDMCAHQYDQQTNQVVCKVSKERVFETNGPEANLFGLEPNFGCCTANMHQGWPKFAAHLWMQSADGGLAAVAYAPCTVEAEAGGKPVRVDVRTAYPFSDTVAIAVRGGGRFPLHLRIPGWVQSPTLTVAGKAEPVKAETFHRIDRDWSGETEVVLRLTTMTTLREGYNKAVTVVRGPLVFALRVGTDWRKLRRTEPFADWEVYPTTPWNYAIDIHPLAVSLTEQTVTSRPFSPDAPPVVAKVTGRRLPGWRLDRNAAAPPPPSPVTSAEPAEELTLVPYGCTSLRVTELPTLK